jgi:hypothetical protein
VSFDDLPLHDGLLAAIHISFEAGRCDLRIHLPELGSHYLVFEGFSNLEFPRHQPWGPSSSINTVREPMKNIYEIELQSGDVLRISAQIWRFYKEQGA